MWPDQQCVWVKDSKHTFRNFLHVSKEMCSLLFFSKRELLKTTFNFLNRYRQRQRHFSTMRKNNWDKWQLTSCFTFGDMLRVAGTMVKKKAHALSHSTAINYCHKGIQMVIPRSSAFLWNLMVFKCWFMLVSKKYHVYQMKHPRTELGLWAASV